MNRLLFANRTDIYIYIVLFLTIPLAMYNVENIIQSLLCSHYTTLVLNNIYLAISYQRIGRIQDMRSILISRLGLKRYINDCCLLSVLSVTIYCSLLYVLNILFYGFPSSEYFMLVALFMIVNYLVLLCEEVILLQQTVCKTKINLMYLMLAIVINLYFHYGIIIPFMENIFR